MTTPKTALEHTGEVVRGKRVGALWSGLAVLRYLSCNEAPVGVTQVARDLDLNTSTCFNLLNTLVREQLVEFHPGAKTYSLGVGMVELARGAMERSSFVRFVRPHLHELATAYGVTTTLWQKSGEDRAVLVERVDSDAAIRVHMTIGQRLPLFIAALGCVMAASSGLSRAELRARFNKLRWQNAPDFDDYYREVQEAGERGYASDVDRYCRGVTTISAPIFADGESAIMALSVVGFSGQFTPSLIETIGKDLRTRTQELSSSLSRSAAGGARPG